MSSPVANAPVIIIGAGPAGLAAAETLAKRKIDYVVLEQGPSVASALRRVDPEMTLLSPTGLSLMPDMKPQRGVPDYLPFHLLVRELERYQEQHNLEVTLNSTVLSVQKETRGFAVRYRDRDGAEHSLHGSHVINATGIISKPRLPANFKPDSTSIPWLHSIDSRGEKLVQSRRLLVVGGGASAADVLESWLKVRQANDHAWLSLRSPLRAVPHWIFGIDVHYFVWFPEQIPSSFFGSRTAQLTEPMTGRTVVNAIHKGLITRMPPVSRYEESAVEFTDGQRAEPDLIVFATGFTYASDHLQGLLDLDPDGRPRVRDCESTRTRGLFLLGFRFGRTFASPYLRGIARDAEYIASRISAEKSLR